MPRLNASTLSLEEFSRYAVTGVPVIITGFNMTPGGNLTPEVLQVRVESDVQDAARSGLTYTVRPFQSATTP